MAATVAVGIPGIAVVPPVLVAKIATYRTRGNVTMRTMTAKDAKNNFGLLLDCARAEPVQVNKHGRPVVVVVSVEEFQRLSGPPHDERQHAATNGKKAGR